MREVAMFLPLFLATVTGPLVAQTCEVSARDSTRARQVADSLYHRYASGSPADPLRLVAFRSGARCVIALATDYSGLQSGSIAILGPSGVTEFAGDYNGVEPFILAADGRLAFVYVKGYGTPGWRQEELVVLCSFGHPMWLECVTFPTLNRGALSEGASEDSYAAFEFRAVPSVQGAAIVLRRSASVKLHGSADWQTTDLGSVVLRLP